MTLVRPGAGSARDAKKSPHRLARLLALGRPIVMGVLNVTPDSFSDGGHFLEPAAAIDHARRMIAEGADVLDIGAESTRPYGGAQPVSTEMELRRLQPVFADIDPVTLNLDPDAAAAPALVWEIQKYPPIRLNLEPF